MMIVNKLNLLALQTIQGLPSITHLGRAHFSPLSVRRRGPVGGLPALGQRASAAFLLGGTEKRTTLEGQDGGD